MALVLVNANFVNAVRINNLLKATNNDDSTINFLGFTLKNGRKFDQTDKGKGPNRRKLEMITLLQRRFLRGQQIDLMKALRQNLLKQKLRKTLLKKNATY